jgi:hypothetical protein
LGTIYYAVSNDGGRNFSAPVTFPHSGNLPAIDVIPNGYVAIAFAQSFTEIIFNFYQCSSWGEGVSHGGDINPDAPITSGIDQNVFDDVTPAERLTGDVEYRKIYVRNESIGPEGYWQNVKVWIQMNTPAAGDTIWITAQGTNSDTQADAVGYTYYQPDSKLHANVQDIGTLAPGDYHHIWMRRVVSAGSGPYANNLFRIAFENT